MAEVILWTVENSTSTSIGNSWSTNKMVLRWLQKPLLLQLLAVGVEDIDCLLWMAMETFNACL